MVKIGKKVRRLVIPRIDRRVLVAAVLVVAVACAVLFFDLAYETVRAVLGLLLVLFLPGFIASYAFRRQADAVERIALSLVLSICLVVLASIFLGFLGVPLTPFSIVVEASVLCLTFAGIARLQNLHATGVLIAGVSSAVKRNKSTVFLLSGALVVAVLLAADLFYPYLVPSPPKNVTQNVTQSTLFGYNFSELYNGSVTVRDFYQGSVSKNLTNVVIPVQALNVFDGKIAFLGYGISGDRVSAGQSLRITYFWKSLESVDVNYTVFVHFTDENGVNVFVADYNPSLPTSLWKVGDVIMEERDFKVPNVKGGTYNIRIGLFDVLTGERAKIVYGIMDPNDRALIGELAVQ